MNKRKRTIPKYIERAVLKLAYDDDGTLVRKINEIMPNAIYILGCRCLNAYHGRIDEQNRKLNALDSQRKVARSKGA